MATPLESLEGADIIRTRVLAALERAENIAASGETDAEEIRRQLTFVLVGGGTVGVEMAGTLAEMFHIALKRDFRHIDLRTARILLYEAGPRVLPTYRENLSLQARRHLEGLGVEVHVNTRVTGVDASGIVADGQAVPAATVVWGAGVMASPAAKWLGVAGDPSGKIVVGPDLSVSGHPEIFAIGDTAHVVAPFRNLIGIRSRVPMVLPGVAQPAIQEGKYVSRLILRRVKNRPAPPPFWYWDKGDLAIVGRTYAVADLRFVRFWGFPAWFIWASVHIYFLIGFANRVFVLLQWAYAFVTKRRRGRVLDQ
jgi:NADH dehydrogenase